MQANMVNVAKFNAYQTNEINIFINIYLKKKLWHTAATKNSKIIRPHYTISRDEKSSANNISIQNSIS